MDFDVLIIGSGPAGTAAALSCLQAGLQVGLVTRALRQEAGEASPLQSIHPGVLPLLEQLGLQGIVPYSSKATFSGIRVNGQLNSLSPEAGETWHGHHLDRHLFDAFLRKILEASDVTVMEQEDIKILRGSASHPLAIQLAGGEKVGARFLIDASGYQRKTRHFLDLEEYFLSAPLHCWTGVAEHKAGLPPAVAETAFFPRKNGWLWVAPESAQRFTWTQLLNQKKQPFALPFPEAQPIGKLSAHNVRWRVFRPVCKEKIILCGDAAGMLDPAAGQGILNALMSGIMAARCVATSLAQPQLEAFSFMEYDQWFITQFEEKVEALKRYYAGLNIDM